MPRRRVLRPNPSAAGSTVQPLGPGLPIGALEQRLDELTAAADCYRGLVPPAWKPTRGVRPAPGPRPQWADHFETPRLCHAYLSGKLAAGVELAAAWWRLWSDAGGRKGRASRAGGRGALATQAARRAAVRNSVVWQVHGLHELADRLLGWLDKLGQLLTTREGTEYARVLVSVRHHTSQEILPSPRLPTATVAGAVLWDRVPAERVHRLLSGWTQRFDGSPVASVGWRDQLRTRAKAGVRRGRPQGTDSPDDRRLYDAWKSKNHDNIPALATAFGRKPSDVRQVLDRFRKRDERSREV